MPFTDAELIADAWLDPGVALADRLKLHPLMTDKVYRTHANREEGDPTPLELPYTMIYDDTGSTRSMRLAASGELLLLNYTVHFVGETREQCVAQSRAAQAMWVNWRPDIPGFTAWKPTHNFSTPVNARDDMRPQWLYIVDEWGLQLQKGKTID